ncbi:spore cortex biosynthesis protein YabQ [Mesobacillus maritimus]|uniref:spore cortex biosynthesis protein YabQ n=1 Tax=Mesobacillus maritimus TaxID=1643336 RepID=UPI00203F9903|nr:spore cortex biosynthesis protein YabQ [Mesobacillus maritimus]MCM3588558.1 spore cortex biosynthesis protein YabQ [Mesobacillus maritimus]MCM3671575.1 spore cortex biosynthesis protein YabQ [Mesobacillus maritimus]
MTLTTQFLTMITMIGMGSLFGASLDTYNRFLQRRRRKNWIVFLNDVLFWILQGLSIFYVLFMVNEGELRFYIFLALLCGFAAYQSLLKRGYLKCLEWVISLMISTYKITVNLIHNLIYRPLRFLLLSIVSLVVFTGKGLFLLLKMILSIVTWILKVVWKPFELIFSLLWKLLPKRIKKNVEKIYNKMAGFTRKFKKYTVNILNKIKTIIKSKK